MNGDPGPGSMGPPRLPDSPGYDQTDRPSIIDSFCSSFAVGLFSGVLANPLTQTLGSPREETGLNLGSGGVRLGLGLAVLVVILGLVVGNIPSRKRGKEKICSRIVWEILLLLLCSIL